LECDSVPGFSVDASGMCLFVLDRRDVAQRGVQPGMVEPGDVLDGRELELGLGPPDAIGDQLGLEAVDERFGHGVGERRQLRSVRPVSSEFV
jgi:hypothetical protein